MTIFKKSHKSLAFMYWMLSLEELVGNFCMCNYFLQYTWADEAAGQCDLPSNCIVAWLEKWNQNIFWTSHFEEVSYESYLDLCGTKNANECYVTGDTSHLQPLTHFYLKEILWQRNLVLLGHVLCSFTSFTLQIEHSRWSGKVKPLSLGNPPSFWRWRLGYRYPN